MQITKASPDSKEGELGSTLNGGTNKNFAVLNNKNSAKYILKIPLALLIDS